jgi:hypothetical protein
MRGFFQQHTLNSLEATKRLLKTRNLSELAWRFWLFLKHTCYIGVRIILGTNRFRIYMPERVGSFYVRITYKIYNLIPFFTLFSRLQL